MPTGPAVLCDHPARTLLLLANSEHKLSLWDLAAIRTRGLVSTRSSSKRGVPAHSNNSAVASTAVRVFPSVACLKLEKGVPAHSSKLAHVAMMHGACDGSGGSGAYVICSRTHVLAIVQVCC